MKTYSGLALAAVLAAAAGAVYTGLPASATQPPPDDRPALPPLAIDPGAKLPAPAPADKAKPAPKAEPPAKISPPVEAKERMLLKPTSPAEAPGPFVDLPQPIKLPMNVEQSSQYSPGPTNPPVAPPANVELPPLPPVSPAPLPVPMPIVPTAKAEPTKLPVVPAPPVAPLPAPPVAQPLPSVPPPVAQPKLPVVPPPPVVAPPAQLPTPAPLPVVPPPVTTAPQAQPLPAPLPVVPPVVEAPKTTPLPAPRAEAQPQPLPPPLTVTPTTPPSVGSVVVLQDGKVVEGHVSRTADKVVVRRGAIDQPFKKEQVKYVAASKDEAYRLALQDTKLDEPAARLRLARWCMYNGMRENALTEAKEVVRLEPANRTAAELARTLEESLRLYPGDGTTRVTPPVVPPAAPGLPAVPPPPATPPVVTVPEPDIAPEAVVAFGPRVQPVLMNQCATCHAKSEYAGAFKLTAVASNETNPTATRANLVIAANQLKKADPAASPLLVKALTAHGGQTTPAFVDRDAAPFRVLHAWAYLAAGELAPPVAAAPPASPALPPAPVSPTLPPPPAQTPTAGVPMLPPPPLPTTNPVLPPAPMPAPPPIPPAVGSLPALPTAPAPMPVPPPIPPATEAPGFGQSAPPVQPMGPSQDEFDPANFNLPLPRR